MNVRKVKFGVFLGSPSKSCYASCEKPQWYMLPVLVVVSISENLLIWLTLLNNISMPTDKSLPAERRVIYLFIHSFIHFSCDTSASCYDVTIFFQFKVSYYLMSCGIWFSQLLLNFSSFVLSIFYAKI